MIGTMAKKAAVKKDLIFPSIKNGSSNVCQRLEVPPSAPLSIRPLVSPTFSA
jgi:hypothetical protein